MITYVKRSNLDVDKYNDLISKSKERRVYAFSWYLDIVSCNWDVLVLDDYVAVMPVTWKRKFFISYIIQPCFCQQLGVFSSIPLSTHLIESFLQSVPNKYIKGLLQFNSNNTRFFNKEHIRRNNYVLCLEKSLEEITGNFNTNRKRSLRKVFKENVVLNREAKTEDFLQFYLTTNNSYTINSDQLHIIKKLLLNENIKIYGVKLNGVYEAFLVWVKDVKRSVYLLPIASVTGKKKGLPTLLVYELIKDLKKNKVAYLDFEGSMIKGVADFYKSFRAEKEEYVVYKM